MNGVTIIAAPVTGAAAPCDVSSRIHVLSPRAGGAGVASSSLKLSLPLIPAFVIPTTNSSSRVSSAQLYETSSPRPPWPPLEQAAREKTMRAMTVRMGLLRVTWMQVTELRANAKHSLHGRANTSFRLAYRGSHLRGPT